MSTEVSTNGSLEVLSGIRINDETIDLFVVSNGCTTKDSFEVVVNKGFTGDSPVALMVIRREPDTCKAAPHVVQLTYSRAELGISEKFEVTVENKVGDTSNGR